jgi:hypothetical protein
VTKLREKNQERKQELHRLLTGYDEELQQWKKEQLVNRLPSYNVARPPLEEHMIALEVEWQLLQETKEQEFAKTLVTMGSLFANNKTDENYDGPSQAVVRHCLMQEYSEQVIHSYHDLAETHDTLTKALERETAKLELKQSYLKQQQKLLAEAKELQEHYQHDEVITRQKPVKAEKNRHEILQQRHDWICGELHYVCIKLGPSYCKRNWPNQETCSSKRKRNKNT